MAKEKGLLGDPTHNIKLFLSGVIRYWRRKKSKAERTVGYMSDDYRTAECYVDAYQCVYLALFGETLPPPKKKKKET